MSVSTACRWYTVKLSQLILYIVPHSGTSVAKADKDSVEFLYYVNSTLSYKVCLKSKVILYIAVNMKHKTNTDSFTHKQFASLKS